jgi:hypothetical protein
MSELTPEEYAAALDRLLDGVDGAGAADAQVRADTESIAKALGLIGGALAAEGGAPAAAGSVSPAAAGGATVVQLSGWRSKLNPRVLAAAATLIVLLGVGIPVALSSGGGTSSSDTAALRAPESATADAATGGVATTGAALAAPQPLADDAYSGTNTAAGAAEAPADAGGNGGGGPATAGAGGGVPAPAAAPNAAGGQTSDTKSAKSAASQAAEDAARQAATPEFEQAVACARAIVIGSVTAVQPDPDGRHVTITVLVEKWIAPTKTGPLSVSYRVLGPTMNTPGPDESVYVGQRRLFVFGPSEDERAYAFPQSSWPETRKKIAAIREQRAGQGC